MDDFRYTLWLERIVVLTPPGRRELCFTRLARTVVITPPAWSELRAFTPPGRRRRMDDSKWVILTKVRSEELESTILVASDSNE